MRIFLLAACACVLAACSSDNAADTAAPMPTTSTSSGGGIPILSSIFGSDDAAQDNTPQLGVNGFLWRASLDTLNFMPLASADPVGGVIISDWYADPAKPDEHVKVTVYILDKRLRADAIKVSVFRQVRTPMGWTDAAVNADTGVKLENAILARARELHLAATQ